MDELEAELEETDQTVTLNDNAIAALETDAVIDRHDGVAEKIREKDRRIRELERTVDRLKSADSADHEEHENWNDEVSGFDLRDNTADIGGD
ncbi:hypothetical protein [Halomicrobium salinisoli]|uniref:hypothetical protein n=1 Tax=Halomicrobium salinisoli TaxID=2878391 RepID=UPI001CEFBC09|nr:hypothetical protein [Halomicrobium salinisoli]